MRQGTKHPNDANQRNIELPNHRQKILLSTLKETEYDRYGIPNPEVRVEQLEPLQPTSTDRYLRKYENYRPCPIDHQPNQNHG